MTREEDPPAEQGRDRGWLAIIGIVVLVGAAFFWPVTLRGQFAILHDSWAWSFPLRSAAWQSIRAGSLPLWTSGIFSGYPLFSMSQLGLAYPLTWFYAFSDAWGEQIYVLCPFVLSPLFVYAYIRELGLSRSASLLGGLAFGYGGFMASPISHNGLMSNGFMWLPLGLAAVERARRGSLLPCLIATSLSFGAAVISGVGQGFVNVAWVMIAYGAFIGVVPRSPLGWRSLRRWRPTVVAFGGVALGAGLGAFQALETMQANRLSSRKSLSYATFSEGTAPISKVLVSVLDPLHQTIGDVTGFVQPVVLVLALVALVSSLRRRGARDPVVLFWTGLALFALLLMFGASTPFYHLAHWTPFLNLFRVPPRHAAEWTLAWSFLGAYGWDAAAAWFGARRVPGSDAARGWTALALLATAIGLTLVWNTIPGNDERIRFLALKVVTTLCTLAALALTWTLAQPEPRVALAATLIVLGAVSEGYLCLSRWWFPAFKTAEYLEHVSPTTEYLRRVSGRDGRVYTHMIGLFEESAKPRVADAPNMTARFGLQEAAGYDPMIFVRYSEALGNTGMFAVPRDPIPDAGYGGPFNQRSHVLDLLNVRYVVRRLKPGEPILPGSWETSSAPDRLVVDVGNPAAQKAMASGFSGAEELAGRSGSWTVGDRSTIRAFLLPLDERYEVRLVAIAFAAAAPLNVTLRVNGKKAGVFKVNLEWRELNIKLPRDALVEGWNEFALVYSRTVSPSSLDPKSADQRKLGMFLDFLSVTPIE